MTSKLKYLYLITIGLLFLNCRHTNRATEGHGNFSIEITVKNENNANLIYLKKQLDNLSVVIDSTILKNGKAIFNGIIEDPEVYGIFLEDNPQGIFPIIEKGTIYIEVHIDSLFNPSIYGTPLNDQLNQFKANASSISSRMNNVFHQFQKARAENDIEKIKKINKELKSINQTLTKYKIDFIKENPDSFVASMVLFSLANEKTVGFDTIEKLYTSFSEEVKRSAFSINTERLLKIQSIDSIDSIR